MEWLEPLINLLVVLTALSVAAERITNVIKLRNPKLRDEDATSLTEKERERGILMRSMIVGIVLALVLKADLVAALQRLDAPWETFGWIQVQGSMWVLAPEARSLPTAVSAVLGSVVTGTALGFGSKFWHEILDSLLELRNMAKFRNVGTQQRIERERESRQPEQERSELEPAGTDR